MIRKYVLFLEKEVNSIIGKIVWSSKDEQSFLIHMIIDDIPDHYQLFSVLELMHDNILFFDDADALERWAAWHKEQRKRNNVVPLYSKEENK